MNMQKSVMTAEDAVALYELFEQNGIVIWIDGGWAVDALLGEQTRVHGDLDIALDQEHVSGMERLLDERGYKRVKREHERLYNFVLGDAYHHEVDVHVFVMDEHGNGIYGPPENSDMYPASSLTGQGTILDTIVRCISPYDLVQFHTGYNFDADDYHDVSLLCEKFGIEMPEEYKRWKG